MEQHEVDDEYLRSRSRMEHLKVTMQQEDAYNARIRVLVIDLKKSNPAARRIAFDEIMGV